MTGWLALACLFTTRAFAADLTVTALKRDSRPLAGAVITLEAESPALPPAQPLRAVLDQQDLAFVPDVLVVPVHSTVVFPNSDAVSHQVYSFSPAKTFQLPLYRGKPYPPVQFDQPGIVTLGCNIHDNMLAYIVVTSAPYFGRTDAQGQWTMPAVPSGRYRVRLWHPLLAEVTTVEHAFTSGAANAAVQIRLSRNLRPAPLTGHPRSWDY